jgi:hypothetical protein
MSDQTETESQIDPTEAMLDSMQRTEDRMQPDTNDVRSSEAYHDGSIGTDPDAIQEALSDL